MEVWKKIIGSRPKESLFSMGFDRQNKNNSKHKKIGLKFFLEINYVIANHWHLSYKTHFISRAIGVALTCRRIRFGTVVTRRRHDI